jgi:hypothetical protein
MKNRRIGMNTVNRQTFTPNMMMFGEEVNLPADIIFGTANLKEN